ncbi:L-2-hydroxyglutarate dehydrogenase, mitochondrial, partial [Orchesella cincta]
MHPSLVLGVRGGAQYCQMRVSSHGIRSFSSKSASSDPGNSQRHGKCYDFTIIGGGIVGTATAMELAKKYPKLKMAVLEKEDQLALKLSTLV